MTENLVNIVYLDNIAYSLEKFAEKYRTIVDGFNLLNDELQKISKKETVYYELYEILSSYFPQKNISGGQYINDLNVQNQEHLLIEIFSLFINEYVDEYQKIENQTFEINNMITAKEKNINNLANNIITSKRYLENTDLDSYEKYLNDERQIIDQL